MTWVRLDDVFSIHKKIAGLSDAAFRLHVSALCWSARNLADGYLDEDDLRDAWPRLRNPVRYATELVARGIWHQTWVECVAPKCPEAADKPGWRIHDYFEYQFSKEQVMSRRAADRDRVNKWRNDRSNGVGNGVTDGVSNAAPVPSRPINGSVVTGLNTASLPVDNPRFQRVNGSAATPQPPPFAEANERALDPEKTGRGRHRR